MSRRTQLPAYWTPIQEAAYRMVHEFREGKPSSGASALAPLVGKTPRSLDNEVNPDATGAKLGVEDAVTLMHASQDFRLLEAMAAALGFAVVKIGDFSGLSDVQLLDAYAQWNTEVGQTHDTIRRALESGDVDDAELAEVRREMFEDFQAELGVLARLEALRK
ncbi:MAG: phage regulatory CII family protein [Pseudomonadota bacterium]